MILALAETGIASNDMMDVWYTLGMALLIFKIVIPLILIVLGMIDLGKAVISSDEKAVSKAAKSLLNRVIAGICIFFIPTIIGLCFSLVGQFKEEEIQEDYEAVKDCIIHPNTKCETTTENTTE